MNFCILIAKAWKKSAFQEKFKISMYFCRNNNFYFGNKVLAVSVFWQHFEHFTWARAQDICWIIFSFILQVVPIDPWTLQ